MDIHSVSKRFSTQLLLSLLLSSLFSSILFEYFSKRRYSFISLSTYVEHVSGGAGGYSFSSLSSSFQFFPQISPALNVLKWTSDVLSDVRWFLARVKIGNCSARKLVWTKSIEFIPNEIHRTECIQNWNARDFHHFLSQSFYTARKLQTKLKVIFNAKQRELKK